MTRAGRRLVLLATAVTLMGAWPAAAQSLSAAMDRAGNALAGALNREIPKGTAIWVAPMQDDTAKVACDPMSSLLTRELESALLSYQQRFGLSFTVVADSDPQKTRVAVSGRWARGGADEVLVRLVMGDVQSAQFRYLGIDALRFAASSLPADAQRCLLEFDMVDRAVKIAETLRVRATPDLSGRTIATLKPGAEVWVLARVRGQGWTVIELPEDQKIASTMGGGRGFVFGLGSEGPVADMPSPSSGLGTAPPVGKPDSFRFQNRYLRGEVTSMGIAPNSFRASAAVRVENYSKEDIRIALKRDVGNCFSRFVDNKGVTCNCDRFSGAAILLSNSFKSDEMTVLSAGSTTSFVFGYHCNEKPTGDRGSIGADFFGEVQGKRSDFSIGVSNVPLEANR